MIRLGKIVAWTILLLLIISVFYPLFGSNVLALDIIVKAINEASIFITMICVFFAIISFVSSPGSLGLFCICIIDIFIANDLFSNEKLSVFAGGLQNINKDSVLWVFFVIFMLSFVFFLGYIIYKIFKGDETSSEYRRKLRKGIAILLVLCAVVAMCGVLDYLFFEYFPLGLIRPEGMNKIKDGLHYAAIVSIAFFAVFIGIFFSLGNKEEKDGGRGTFRLSAFISAVLVVLTIFLVDRISIYNTVDKFISAITDNTFLVIMTPIILFFVYQIVVTIILHFFSRSPKDRNILGDWEKHVAGVEKGLLKAAYDIINGCIQLLNFIPDFFNAIGVIFLDQEDRLEREKGNRDSGNGTDSNAENERGKEEKEDGKEDRKED